MEKSADETVAGTKLAADRYLIDSTISRFTVRAFATGFLSALGHSPTIAIREFDGEVRKAPDSFTDAWLRLRIQSRSLEVQDQISDKDRREMERQMNRDVLETHRFPEIVYECSSVSEGSAGNIVLNGKLTLHGATRDQPVSARLMMMGTLLKASGEFSIRQSDYDIRPVSAVGGTLKLKDELKASFDIAARKQS
jgi:polyisoprenoid-binding protein YceI